MLKILRGIQDYLFRKDLWVDAKHGFNGQVHRQRIFTSLMSDIAFDAIVETGTFRGVTTEYMRQRFHGPIFTVEQHPRYFGFSRARLFLKKRIHLFLMDSVKFLREVLPSKLPPDRIVFFYLDAHWETHLPLREELEIIFKNHPKSVVMIDDFKVPDDHGYRFDDYGPGKSIDPDYVKQADLPAYAMFFPSAASKEETGSKRGCAVICVDPALLDRLSKNPNLRRWM